MNCPQINACFNPFEEYKNKKGERIIPGISLDTIFAPQWAGIAFIPLSMTLYQAEDLSNTKMFLDYSSGMFYEKNNIVRVDKNKMEVYFRNGGIAKMSNLKGIKLKNMNGLELAKKINNTLMRIR